MDNNNMSSSWFINDMSTLICHVIGIAILMTISPLRYPRTRINNHNTIHNTANNNATNNANNANNSHSNSSTNSNSGNNDTPSDGHVAYIVFKNIHCSMERLVSQLDSRGFQIHKVYQVSSPTLTAKDNDSHDGDNDMNLKSLFAVCGLSTRLLLKMTGIYANDLSTIKSNDILSLPFQLRMMEKAIATLNPDFKNQLSYQLVLLPEIPSSLNAALSSGKLTQLTQELHKYFGSKIALALKWLQFCKQLIYPGLILYLLMLFSNEWGFIPVVGTLVTIVISCGLAYWRVARSFDLHKYVMIKQWEDLESLEYLRNKDKPYPTIQHILTIVALNGLLFIGFGVVNLFIVYIFDRIFRGHIIWCLVGEIFYYMLMMSCAVASEYIVIQWLTKKESHRIQREERLSFACKQFVAKVGVFVWKVVYVVFAGKKLERVQAPLTFLMILHCFAYDHIVKFIGNKFPQPCKLSLAPLDIKEAIPENVCMFESRDIGLLRPAHIDELGLRVLQQISRNYFSVSTLYADSILSVAAMLILCPMAPASMPITVVLTSMKLRKSLHRLCNDCQFPRISEDSTMDPYLAIIEVYSIVVIAWNILTMFVFSINSTSFAAMVAENATGPPEDVDGFLVKVFCYLNSNFGLTNSFASMIVWLIAFEHVALYMRCFVWPVIISMHKEFDLQTQRALKAVAEGNEFIATQLYRANLLTEAAYLKAIDGEQTAVWKHQYSIAETHHEDDPSMSPLLYAGLAMVPFICSRFFHISYKFSAPPLALMCGYYHMKIKRTKRAVALAIVSDPDVFDVVAEKEFPSYSYSKDTDRSAWCNKMFELTWSALKQFAYNSIKAAADPELEKNKPSFASHLKMSKLTMGNVPPQFLPGGIRILEPIPGKDMVEMEVDIVWNSDMEMAISLGLLMGQEITLNMSKLRFSGTLRVQCLPLIPFMPPFAWGKATFFKRPFIDFNLNFGDTELLDATTSSSSITTVMQRILRNVLETMALYPAWITIPMVSKLERFAKTKLHSSEYYLTSYPVGILSIKILKCNDLIVGDITTSDPYVVLTIRDEEFKTEVINATLNPVWKDAEFFFLIYDKNMEFIHLEVWDKDVGSVGTFLGRVDVYIPKLEDGGSQSLTLQLQGVSSGTITMDLGYNDIANNIHGSEASFVDSVVEMKTLLDTMDEGDMNHLLMFSGLGGDGIPAMSVRPSQRRFTKVGNGFKSFDDLTSTVSVAGVLTVSLVGFQEVKSVASVMAGTQYFSPYLTFSVGALKRQTNPSSTKKSTMRFNNVYTFVVRDIDSDILRAKLKYINAMGSHVTLCEHSIAIKDVIDQIGTVGKLAVRKNVYEDLKLAVGEIYFTISFKSTVAHIRRQKELD